MADDRTYIRVHDGMDDHPKIVGLSDGAFRLLMRAWSYCSRQLTDGQLPEAAWRDRGSAKSRRELVDAGLAHLPGFVCHHPECPAPPPKHVQMHDYLEHQRSAAEVAELKRKRAEAGRRGGQAKANALASAKQMPEQTASKTVPSTETDTDTYLETSVEGGSHVSRARPREPPLIPITARARGRRGPAQVRQCPTCGSSQRRPTADAGPVVAPPLHRPRHPFRARLQRMRSRPEGGPIRMTGRPVTDERDPLPPREWQPTSHEWARRQAREAAAAAVRAAREKRTAGKGEG